MNEQSGADGAESLPAPSHDGEPFAEYIARTVKADFRAAVQEDSYITTVQARLWPVFRPAVFSLGAVQRFYEAYSKVDKNADASRYERELRHFWTASNPATLPRSARMVDVPQPELGIDLRPTVTLVGRFHALTALFGAARARDLLLAQFCDSLRQGKLQAIGFLADDHAMEIKPIPPGRWGDSAMVCAWREGELRPRAEAPPGTPYYRGLRIGLPEVLAASTPAPDLFPSAHGIEAEDACVAWLNAEWPQHPGRSKDEWFAAAKRVAAWKSLPEEAFKRSWAVAAATTHPEMSRRGRKARQRN